jgi:hypothetical protein
MAFSVAMFLLAMCLGVCLVHSDAPIPGEQVL